jgi:hypothetical protein
MSSVPFSFEWQTLSGSVAQLLTKVLQSVAARESPCYGPTDGNTISPLGTGILLEKLS